MADGGREGVYGRAYFMKSKILCKRKVYKQDKMGRNNQSPLKTRSFPRIFFTVPDVTEMRHVQAIT